MSKYYIVKEDINKHVTVDMAWTVRKKGVPVILATFSTKDKAEKYREELEKRFGNKI